MSAEVFRVPITVPMRDGIHLSADLYTGDPASPGRRPVILQRTCYDRNWPDHTEPAIALARHGYTTVVQEARGRNASEGVWGAHEQEAEDGFDTIEWLATQDFCDGQVGTLGASYAGWVQLAAEHLRPPSLKAMLVTSSHLQMIQAFGRDRGFRLFLALQWVYMLSHRNMRPVEDIDWDEVFRHRRVADAAARWPEADPLWRRWMTDEGLRLRDPVRSDAPVHISVPTLHVSGWEDEPGETGIFRRAVEGGSADQYLMVGPWDHPRTWKPAQVVLGRDYGPHAVIDIHRVYAAWFDRWLGGRGDAVGEERRVAVFMNGLDRWLAYASWPEAGQERAFWLNGAELVAERPEEGRSVTIAHDPANPVDPRDPDADPDAEWTLVALDRHPGVFAATSQAFAEGLDISGLVTVTIETSSTASIAEWCLWLAEVDAAGVARRVTSAAERRSYEREDDRRAVRVELGPVCTRIAVGHRLRLYVAGSNFPLWDVLGWHDADGDPVTTVNTVHSGEVVVAVAASVDPLDLLDAPMAWTKGS